MRQSRTLPKHKLEKGIYASLEKTVLARSDPVPDRIQIFNREHRTQVSLESCLHSTAAPFRSTVLLRSGR